MRSFIAFKPPEGIARQIGRLQAHLRSEGVEARWVKPSNIHLTLKFLGETDTGRDGDIRRAMQTAVAGQAPLELALGGLGGFPNISRPRVLWQAVAMDVDRLQAIQQRLETLMVPCGFPRERRPFRGHLTIGRIRSSKRWRPEMAAIVKAMPDLPLQPYVVDALIWYQSRLLPGGAEYTALARIPLVAT